LRVSYRFTERNQSQPNEKKTSETQPLQELQLFHLNQPGMAEAQFIARLTDHSTYDLSGKHRTAEPST